MWALVIVAGAPCRNHVAGMAQRREQVLVQALLAHPCVEAFHQAVLHGLSGCDIVPVDLAILLPFEHHVRGQLRPVVADHKAWIASQLGDPVQLTGDMRTVNGCVDYGGQAFLAEVVDDIQHPVPPPVFMRVQHEVERPPLVWALRDCHERPRPDSTLATAPFTNG